MSKRRILITEGAGEVIDLMAALKESLAAEKAARACTPSSPPAPTPPTERVRRALTCASCQRPFSEHGKPRVWDTERLPSCPPPSLTGTYRSAPSSVEPAPAPMPDYRPILDALYGTTAAAPSSETPTPHPEDTCQQCGGPNIVWFAPNEVWNAVMPDDGGILCPACFVKAAVRAGVDPVSWRVTPEPPRPTNAQHEPHYPGSETVTCSIRFPLMTCHHASPRCQIEAPHLVVECGEISPEVAALRASLSSLREAAQAMLEVIDQSVFSENAAAAALRAALTETTP
jgi:hypothetical protein